MSKSKELLLKAKQKSGKLAVVGAGAGATLLASAQTFALDAASNTEITTALESANTSTGLVVAGLITLAAVVTGLGLVYKLLGK